MPRPIRHKLNVRIIQREGRSITLRYWCPRRNRRVDEATGTYELESAKAMATRLEAELRLATEPPPPSGRRPRGRTVWVYKHFVSNHVDVDQLAAFGAQGWELIAVSCPHRGSVYEFFFKRRQTMTANDAMDAPTLEKRPASATLPPYKPSFMKVDRGLSRAKYRRRRFT